MRTSRVILHTLLAAAVAAAVVMPRDASVEPPQLDGIDARMQWASERASVQYEMARRLQSRAAALETAAGTAGTAGLVVRADPSVDGARAARVEALARQWWTLLLLGSDAEGASLAVTLIADSTVEALGVPAASAGHGWSSDVFIPPLGSSSACHVVLRLPRSVHDRGDVPLTRTMNSALTRCHLVVRYGPPGPGVRTWLEDRRYGALLVARRVNTGRVNVGLSLRGEYWALRSERVRLERGCLAGRDDACTDALLAPWNDTWRPTGFPGGWTGTRGPVLMDALGALLLDRVERSIGTDAFAALWRDTTPFAVSVVNAMQQPLATVVRASLQDGHAMAADTRVTRGPLPPVGGLVPPLLLVVACLGVGSRWYDRRRSDR